MIIEAILDLIFLLFSPIFDLMSSLHLDSLAEAYIEVPRWICGILYFFPMPVVTFIISSIFAIYIFRIIVVVWRTILDCIPLA